MKNLRKKNSSPWATGKSQSGFSLIDVAVAMGIASAILLILLSSIPIARQILAANNSRVSAVAARQIIFKNLARYDSFKKTLSANAQFNCARTFTACAGGTNFILKYDDVAGSVAGTTLYDPTNAMAGLNYDGTTCAVSSGTAPGPDCPVRVDFTWTPVCTTCTPAGMIRINANFTIFRKMVSGVEDNYSATQYNFVLYKNIFQRDCNLPWGGYILHGDQVLAYSTSTGPCVSETRSCNDSVLSGSYTFRTCL